MFVSSLLRVRHGEEVMGWSWEEKGQQFINQQ